VSKNPGFAAAILDKLGAELAALERDLHPAGYAVAYSGGIDSTVLLAACRRLDPAVPLRALHVDHGLHVDSGAWTQHCRRFAESIGVELESVAVDIDRHSGQSVEALARDARYSALQALMRAGEVLLTAHHRDDQLETVLMRLLRGSGVRGLRGITACSRLPPGHLARPLLDVSRDEIWQAAAAWKLQWLDDPSNDDERFDRNYWRAVVLPGLKRRWPSVGVTVSRTARQMRDAEEILAEVAAADAVGLGAVDPIPRRRLTELTPARQRNLLRQLLESRGLPLPDAARLEQVLCALRVARRDARPHVAWPGAEARVFRDALYLMPPLGPRSEPGYSAPLAPGEAWIGPEGRIELIPADGDADAAPGLPDTWVADGLRLSFRCGGERFKPAGSGHNRALKKLLQEAGIVPWMRSRIPLLRRDDALMAVGDLWVSDAARFALGAGARWRVRWTKHPALY
jgi:tRNA(Ile)-lysidine synthase